ncbi:cytochrome P450 2J6-like [Gouania willdenowi]|uniref:Cytochrome P450 2J6-like n=1 Tax=Gouania willdenowi TaxID=441366 RepID=A0A8C5D4E9_GOUWI|nr:cytochrome P450 2J6-like [Gouania willdenowi]
MTLMVTSNDASAFSTAWRGVPLPEIKKNRKKMAWRLKEDKQDYFKNRRPKGFPPGPRGLPIVGNIFSVDQNKTHESLTQFARKYGNVYSIRMGQTWMVVLNSLEVLKEGLITQGDSMVERPDVPLLDDVLHKQDLFSGKIWKQQRRFALSTLRHFGFGKKSLEQVVLDEFTNCAAYFSKYKGSLFNPQRIVTCMTSNIICSIVFGHRFEYSDEKFVNLIDMFDEAFQIQESIWSKLYNSFPGVMRLLPGPHQTFLQIWESVKDFIREKIREHKKTWDPSEPRDFIDCYLNEIEMNKEQNDSDIFNEETLIGIALDLFSAGTETTSTTIRWAFLYMVKYPEIQEKVQAEIDRVIGQYRQPSCDDRTKMPYTNAVIHEIQRISNIVPLSVAHATNKEVQLLDYTIPKGIVIIPNLTSVLLDENEWETPNTFNPGHFQNKEGEFVKRAAFLPFSAGKRACLGENLAKMELFLFFTSFMQQFTFSMPAGVKPVMDYRFGITLSPQPFEICAQSRLN